MNGNTSTFGTQNILPLLEQLSLCLKNSSERCKDFDFTNSLVEDPLFKVVVVFAFLSLG